jgi:hypothetical protein
MAIEFTTILDHGRDGSFFGALGNAAIVIVFLAKVLLDR